jgi:type I restriction enzyme M protein
VQNGWVGRIIPFELVQKSLLSYEMNLLKSKEDKLAEIANSFVDLLDSLTEEDKEGAM